MSTRSCSLSREIGRARAPCQRRLTQRGRRVETSNLPFVQVIATVIKLIRRMSRCETEHHTGSVPRWMTSRHTSNVRIRKSCDGCVGVHPGVLSAACPYGATSCGAVPARTSTDPAVSGSFPTRLGDEQTSTPALRQTAIIGLTIPFRWR
jgi:hypothetical protein